MLSLDWLQQLEPKRCEDHSCNPAAPSDGPNARVSVTLLGHSVARYWIAKVVRDADEPSEAVFPVSLSGTNQKG